MSKNGFKPEQLFGSKTRARLLGLFLLNENRAFFVRELTRKIDAQLNSVRRELKNLIALGIVEERPEKRVPKSERTTLSDKKKYYGVNQNSILFEDLRSMFKKSQVLFQRSMVDDICERGSIDYMAFTGRFVDQPDLPTDLLIIGSIDVTALQRVLKKIEKEMGHEVNYTLMSRDEFTYRKQVMDRFLVSLLEGKKIVMVNSMELDLEIEV